MGAAIDRFAEDFRDFQIEARAGSGRLFDEIASIRNTYDVFRFLLELPDPDPILMRTGYDQEVLDELMADDRLTTTLLSRKSSTLKREWRWEAGLREGEEEASTEATELRDNIARNLTDEFMHDKIAEMLNACVFGYVPVEIMYAPNGGRIDVVDLRPRDRKRFKWDGNGNARFYPESRQLEGIPLPPYKFEFAQHYPEALNPYGLRLASRCFWPITFKRAGYKFWMQFAEYFGMPHLIAKVSNAVWQKDKGQETAVGLQKLVQDGIGVIPEGTELTALQAGSGHANAFFLLIDGLDKRITQLILGETLTTDPGERGARSLGEVQQEVAEDRVETDERIVEGLFNRVARNYTQLNTQGLVPAPRMSFDKPEDLRTERAGRDRTLFGMGVRFSPTYVQREYSFREGDLIQTSPPDPPEDSPSQQFQRARLQDPDRNIDDLVLEQSRNLVGYTEAEGQSLLTVIKNSPTLQDMEDAIEQIAGPEDPRYQDALEYAMMAAHQYGRTVL